MTTTTHPYLADGVTVDDLPHPLGRLEIPDPRDSLFMASDRAPFEATDRTHNYRRAGWRGDQNIVRDPDGRVRPKPWCTAFSGMHALEMMGRPGDPDTWDLRWLYHEAQRYDQWEGEDYDGTSVRAVLHVLKREGAIAGYFWLRSGREALDYAIHKGPVVVGSKWTQAMFEPDRDGFLWPAGRNAGGHAWVVNGGNRRRDEAEMTNSWGEDWGDEGRAKVKVNVLDELIRDRGEACVIQLPA